ncbi:hypothetical protein JOM56_014527 [Amanita muscaria]
MAGQADLGAEGLPLSNPKGSPPDDAAATTDQRLSFHKCAAYDLARVKAIRDIFWRCAGVHPGWWDWFSEAHVPSALSKEMEEGKGLAKVENALVEATATPSVRASMGEKNKVERMAAAVEVSSEFGEGGSRADENDRQATETAHVIIDDASVLEQESRPFWIGLDESRPSINSLITSLMGSVEQ